MTTHYEKYKETIKKVARRNYRKRVAWLNTHLGNEHCIHCGESETVCLKLKQKNQLQTIIPLVFSIDAEM